MVLSNTVVSQPIREEGAMTISPAPSPSPDQPAGHRPSGGRGAVPSPRELEARLRAPGDLTESDLDAMDALDRLYCDPADYDPAQDDPDYRPDAAGELDGSGYGHEPAVPDILDAGFTYGYPQPGATGFRADGPLAAMLPGSELAWHLGAARQRGLGALSDYELIGVLAAARRVQSWQAELELAATAELDARRARPDGREGEHVDDELAAALRLTGRSAQDLLELARQLERLPCTRALLAAGVIDRSRAAVIAAHLGLLDDDAAAAVDAAVAVKAGQQTTGQLGAACHSKVLGHDPDAYARRKKQAEKNARVECWTEPSGTAAIAGRDLDRSVVVCGDKNLDADARWLAAHGAEGSHEELRAAAFVARLSGQPLRSLLSAPPTTPTPANPTTPSNLTTPSNPTTPANPACPFPGDQFPGTAFPAGHPRPGPGFGWLNGINLTATLATWLELTDAPGEISGTGAGGAADAATCRQLTDLLARSPKTRWCITLTDNTGRPIAHGCARAGPGPPGSDKRAWLASVEITPIETGTCTHRHQSAGYHPAPALRHRIKIRSPRCGFPGCRRSAWRCDDDHTVPWHLGGKSCECNLYPLCRHHHQCKQSQGWHLSQPEPGVLVWTTPSGHTYTATAEPYPV
jgi:hypothetical protein